LLRAKSHVFLPSGYCPHLHIILTNLPSCLFPCSHTFFNHCSFLPCCISSKSDKMGWGRCQRRIVKPVKHSPAHILCLPQEHSSHPWQPASLFTYPVCRHMIAMTTSWLPCQFSDAIVLSLCTSHLLFLPFFFLHLHPSFSKHQMNSIRWGYFKPSTGHCSLSEQEHVQKPIYTP